MKTITTCKVYRVEDVYQDGPYHTTCLSDWVDPDGDYHNGVNDHPCPAEEGLSLNNKTNVCGFVSLDQLHRWFTDPELERLQGLGYNVVVYQTVARQVWNGKCQCVFDPAYAEYIWPLTG